MTRLRRILALLAAWLSPACDCPHGEGCPWSDAGVGT